MQTNGLVPGVFALLALVAGIGLLFVRVNAEQLQRSSHSMPGFALFRFRAYRYAAAIVCFGLAALGVAAWTGLV